MTAIVFYLALAVIVGFVLSQVLPEGVFTAILIVAIALVWLIPIIVLVANWV